METEYLWIEYKKPNIFGQETSYDLRVKENELLGVLYDLFMGEFGINYTQFKTLLNEGFLKINADELIERYHEDLLETYSWEIEQDYQEQLEEEREYHNLEEREHYSEYKARCEANVHECMFH